MNIEIPPAALEAGARVIREKRRSVYSDEGLARAAFLAMLAAWPGMREGQAWNAHTGDLRWSNSIILPLTENLNAET